MLLFILALSAVLAEERETYSLETWYSIADMIALEADLVQAISGVDPSITNIEMGYSSLSQGGTDVEWAIFSDNGGLVNPTYWPNLVNAELLQSTELRRAFNLTSCVDFPELIPDDYIAGVHSDDLSCSVIATVFARSFEGCNDPLFVAACPLTCGQCLCSEADCSNNGVITDTNYADGCECTCNDGWRGDHCQDDFSYSPSALPSIMPSFTSPSFHPSIAPSCYTFNPDQLGNADLEFNTDATFMDNNGLHLVLMVPNIYEILSLSFADSTLATYDGTDNAVWTETSIVCGSNFEANLDFAIFEEITSFDSASNRFCSTLCVQIYENHYANRNIEYDMPFCVELGAEVQISAAIGVEVDEPNFLQVSTSVATTHPDVYSDEALLTVEFTTQVVFPYSVEDSLTWGATDDVIESTAVLTETSSECNSRDFCWQHWILSFRVDSVCLRVFNLNIQMTAVYDQYSIPFTILGELHPEAGCAVAIDSMDTPLRGEILLSPKAFDFSEPTQLYRYHVNETVNAEITISDYPAPIDALTIDSFTLTQFGNSWEHPYNLLPSSASNVVVATFSLEAPVSGTAAGVMTTLTVDLVITYGDGTVRRRRLNVEQEPTTFGTTRDFIIQDSYCSAPEGHAGELLRSDCQVGGSQELRLCQAGSWLVMGAECPQTNGMPDEILTEDVIVVTESSNQDTSVWEALFFSVLALAILFLGFATYYHCCRDQRAVIKSDSWSIQANTQSQI